MEIEESKLAEIKKLARKIGRLTNNNNHNESVLVLAKFLDHKTAIEMMVDIKRAHFLAGYMETTWINERFELMQLLLVEVEQKYGKEVRNLINSNF